MPWLLYLAQTHATVGTMQAPAELWKATWPILLGGLLAMALARANRLPPRVPSGDVVVVLDTALRRWPVVRSALLLVVLVFVTAVLTRR